MTRDFSFAQFGKAARQNGFTVQLLGLHDAGTGITFGYTVLKRGSKWKVQRRLSLARAIKEREKHTAKAEGR